MKKMMIFVFGVLVGWATLSGVHARYAGADTFNVSDKTWVMIFTAASLAGGTNHKYAVQVAERIMKIMKEKGY